MDELYYKPREYGSYTPVEIIKWGSETSTELNGKWIPARPIPFQSLITRIKQAWDVLTYKADALYWGIR